MFQKVAEFAALKHAGQVDKAGKPYWLHPERVASLVQSVPGFSKLCFEDKVVVVSAAYLHDVVEDCDVSVDDVAAKFGSEVADVVALLSKNVNDDAVKVAEHPLARLVKLADVADNSNVARVALLKEQGVKFNHNKYKAYLKKFDLSSEEQEWFSSAVK